MSSKRQGRFLGVPYDWRRPSERPAGEQKNPEQRVLVPKTFGWGYGVDLGALRRKLVRR